MKTKITKRSQFPKYLQPFKQLKGIFVGGCIDKNHVWWKYEVAHAHCDKSDKYPGWVCLRYKYIFHQKLTMLHEVAHVIANKTRKIKAHGKEWKKAVVEIGGTFKSYTYLIKGRKQTFADYTHRYGNVVR